MRQNIKTDLEALNLECWKNTRSCFMMKLEQDIPSWLQKFLVLRSTG
ncbi:hypothetical protein FB480_103252 [Agrobacterium vitis]|nr:hypothetical protein FB480_103252 [Agrobacterium vitis]